PSVDDDVPGLDELREPGNQLADDGSRDHHPGGPRRLQLPDEVLERRRPRGPFLLEVAGDVRGPVPYDAFVPGAHDPLREVGSHAAESDHAELHLASFRDGLLNVPRSYPGSGRGFDPRFSL